MARVEYENGLYYLFLQDGYHDSKQIIVYESEIFYLFRGWGIDTTKFAELRKNCRINIHGEYVYNNPYLEALNYSSANEYAESKKDSYDSYTEAFLFWEKCNTLCTYTDKMAFCRAFMNSFCFYSDEYYSAANDEEKKIICEKNGVRQKQFGRISGNGKTIIIRKV